MEILTYLYDASGKDQEIKFEDFDCSKLREDQLCWMNVLRRDEKLIRRVAKPLAIEKDIPVNSILKLDDRPRLERYDKFYKFSISSVEHLENNHLKKVPIDYLVGKNFIITIHDGHVEYFQKFRQRDKGETQIGRLDAEGFLATLLDLHLVTYFEALEKIENEVDKLDVKILKRDLRGEDFLRETIRLKSDVARLRRWLLPHRDIFYTLARPDFTPVTESDSAKEFQMLSQHFDHVVEAVESARDTVLSLFDLYATHAAHKTNNFIKRLTFITLMIGTLGAVAGIWGMNFEVEYFKSAEYGFWLTLSSMGAFLLISLVLGKIFRWF